MRARSTKPWSFDIDRAISTWRQFIAQERTIRGADLEELEIHLRDEWEAIVREGADPEEAFRRALQNLGDIAVLESSFKEVSLEKRMRRGQVKSEILSAISMTGNYLKSAWRSITRHRGFAAINVVGLSLALAPALVIGVFIRHSTSFDQFHEGADLTYRITQDRGTMGTSARPSYGLADHIHVNWAGAETVTQALGEFSTERQLSIDGVHFLTEGVLAVDENFLDVFSFPIKSSLTDRPLETARSIILTESTARRLFGDEEPLGQRILFDASTECTVSAIVFDPPTNTHLPFNALVRSFSEPLQLDWNRFGPYTYVRLEEGSSAADLENYLGEQYSAAQPGAQSSFRLQPITEIYLKSGVADDYSIVGDMQRLYLFGAIAILILVLASINYMNLATARASNRIKEVGVRKVVGATGKNVRRQFLVESLLLITSTVPIALLLSYLMLPYVNQVTGEQLSLMTLHEPLMWTALALLILIIALGAGIYPASVMARQDPVVVFSGGRSGARGRIVVRRALVGVQVAISFAMIVATLLVSNQLRFMRDSNLGFDREQVVTIAPHGWTPAQFAQFKERILSHSSVVSAALGPPPGIGWRLTSWTTQNEETGSEVELEGIYVGPEYFETMNMEIVEGRGFRPDDFLKENTPVVVTESYAATFGSGETLIGKQSELAGAGPIVGVIKDFRNTPFTDSKMVSVFQAYDSFIFGAVIKLARGQTAAGLSVLQAAWTEISPDRTFKYEFLDDRIQAQYVAEVRFSKILGMIAGLSVIIASLGLFGITAFTAKQRVRELSIRKSLGASETHLVFLLSREFLMIVFAGVAVASPIVYFLGSDWLSQFTDHVPMDTSVFMSAGLLCFAFVIVAVGYQAFRAARTNPTEVLRCN